MSRASRQQFSSFLLPLDPLVLVRRTEGDSLEEFRLIKIHFELIPERTKGISILQRRDKRSLSARVGSESELTRSQAAEPKSSSVTGRAQREYNCLPVPYQFHGKEGVKH